jgi:hypothetical protein
MEYAETFGVDMNTAYDQLQAAAKQLYKRSITFYEPAHKRSGKPLPPTMVQMRWVGSVKYHQGRAGSNWHGGRISFGTCSASKRSSRPTSYSKRPRCARATRGSCWSC